MPASFDAAAADAKPRSLDAVDIDQMNEVKAKMASAEPGSEETKFLGGVGGVYAMYFLTHPAYVTGNVARHWRLIFTQTLDLEATIDRGAFAKLGAQKFVRPGETTPFIAGASTRLSAADYIAAHRRGERFWRCARCRRDCPGEIWSFVPLLLAATGVVNAILGFFGDVWERSEMERHAFIGSMVLRLGLILCLLRLIEEARRRWAPERPSAPERASGQRLARPNPPRRDGSIYRYRVIRRRAAEVLRGAPRLFIHARRAQSRHILAIARGNGMSPSHTVCA